MPLPTLTSTFDHIKLQSTAIISMDVPEKLADRYYTGAFTIDGAIDMKDMLLAVSGDEDSLAKMPRAVCVHLDPNKGGMLKTDFS